MDPSPTKLFVTLFIFYIFLGFTLLLTGGSFLVDNATKIARYYGVRPIIIGLTVVAIGTSLPEAVVSLLASINGNGDIVVTNVIGSNIANIALVLGGAAIISTIPTSESILKIELPIMLFASALLLAFTWDLMVVPVEGIILLLCALMFTLLMIYLAKKGGKKETTSISIVSTYGLLALGLIFLFIGGHFALEGSVSIAKELGLSERIIGLTIVAVGTTLPEIVTSIIGSIKKSHDLVIGNLIGSNIYNIFFVLGISSVGKAVSITPKVLEFDIWFMLGFSLLIFGLLLFFKKISRGAGLVLTTGWVGYIFLVIQGS